MSFMNSLVGFSSYMQKKRRADKHRPPFTNRREDLPTRSLAHPLAAPMVGRNSALTLSPARRELVDLRC